MNSTLLALFVGLFVLVSAAHAAPITFDEKIIFAETTLDVVLRDAHVAENVLNNVVRAPTPQEKQLAITVLAGSLDRYFSAVNAVPEVLPENPSVETLENIYNLKIRNVLADQKVRELIERLNSDPLLQKALLLRTSELAMNVNFFSNLHTAAVLRLERDIDAFGRLNVLLVRDIATLTEAVEQNSLSPVEIQRQKQVLLVRAGVMMLQIDTLIAKAEALHADDLLNSLVTTRGQMRVSIGSINSIRVPMIVLGNEPIVINVPEPIREPVNDNLIPLPGAQNGVNTDRDNDTISDNEDNCPGLANADQQDVDRDGIGDVCDNFVAPRANFPPVGPAPNVPIEDQDADTIPDNTDNCLANANPDQQDIDQDGLGDVCDNDQDGDGVVNAADNCPAVANANQANVDGDNLGDACDQDQNPIISAEQQRFNDLQQRYEEAKDDYREFKNKYEDAIEDDDSSDIRRYKNKLDDLRDNLDELEDDIKDFIDDIEDDAQFNSLENDAEDLKDDVAALKEKINSTLGDKPASAGIPLSNYEPPRNVKPAAPQDDGGVVIVPYNPSVIAPELEAPATNYGWEEIRLYAWLGVGALALIGVVLLMIAALVRK